MKVKMTYTSYGSYDERGMLVVELDGKFLGSGGFGGEPEDNMRCRDYAWVEPLLVDLAQALGAEVEQVELKDEE